MFALHLPLSDLEIQSCFFSYWRSCSRGSCYAFSVDAR
jgi:hypothetical protein